MENNYSASIGEHAKECVEHLDVLSKQSQQRNLTKMEYYAAERLLQVLIEVAIGFYKQQVKKLTNTMPRDAYQGFLALADKGIISTVDLEKWKKIIGLRNILVHGYLNVERKVVETILKNRLYEFVFHFLNE